MANTPISNAFISVNDIVNNFIISYTGAGKIIPDSKRTEVIFHARRCLQEFAYETIKSQFQEDKTVSTNQAYALPSDFVAVIKVKVGTLELVESTTTPPAAGKFYIDFVAKTIRYGTGGSAVLTYLVGSMYSEKKVVDSVASVIVTSTVMSIITVPIVVFYSLKYFQ